MGLHKCPYHVKIYPRYMTLVPGLPGARKHADVLAVWALFLLVFGQYLADRRSDSTFLQIAEGSLFHARLGECKVLMYSLFLFGTFLKLYLCGTSSRVAFASCWLGFEFARYVGAWFGVAGP